ncbi:bifunctional metallophosphatase/5'-nucleotidase [Jatrophihabitans sp. YIM 134969]
MRAFRPLRRPLAALAVVTAVAAGGLTLAVPAAAAPGDTVLTLFDVNDFHGRIEPVDETDDGAPVGGAAQLAGMLDQLQTANSAFVSAGDNIGASTFVSAIQDDDPTIDALNAMDLVASATGNHEFDKGADDLTGRVEDRADFPILGANVYRDGSRLLDPYVVTTIAGVQVGFVGVVTEQTASLVSPAGIAGVTFTDPVAEASTVADQLKDGDPTNGEADVVVLLAHEGAPTSDDCAAVASDAVFGPFTRMTGSVDAIFSGHTHQTYTCVIEDPDGNPRPVLQTGNYGNNLGKITLTYNSNAGDVTDGTADLLPIVGYPDDPEVAAIVADAVAESEELGREPVGAITADITRAVGADGEEDRGSESALGNFIADVQLAGTADPGRGGAQIALMNPGGLRADLLVAASANGGGEGVVTYSEAFSVQPFENDVVTRSYTGQEIEDALEQQWQPAGASRPVLHLGVSAGFSYGYRADAPAGSHIVPGSMTLDGTPIDLAGSYRVTVNSFLAAGGDNFTALGGGTNPITTGDNDLTMLVDYLRANSPVTADTAPRSVLFVGPGGTPSSPTTGPSTAPTVVGGGPELAATGSDPWALLGVGVLLVVGGAFAVASGRSRRRARHAV